MFLSPAGRSTSAPTRTWFIRWGESRSIDRPVLSWKWLHLDREGASLEFDSDGAHLADQSHLHAIGNHVDAQLPADDLFSGLVGGLDLLQRDPAISHQGDRFGRPSVEYRAVEARRAWEAISRARESGSPSRRRS